MNNAFAAPRAEPPEPWDPDMLYTHLCRYCRSIWRSTTNGGQVISRYCPSCIEKRMPRADDQVLNRLIKAERRAALEGH